MPKSRRLPTDTVYIRCRKCGQEKTTQSFYSALDEFLDTNGYMSVCKECCADIYNTMLNVELDVRKATFKTCKILNIAYIDDCVDSAILQIDNSQDKEKKQIGMDSMFGVYKSKLGNYFRQVKDIPRTFESYSGAVKFNEEDAKLIEEAQGEDFSKYLKNTWGSGLSIEDYNFLEASLGEWKRTHKCETNSELILMQEICHTQLQVRKARESGQDTKTLVKALQDIIKTANLSPAQANMSGASKGNEIFGMWIKDIEQLEPAEWWDKNRDPFIDVDNISQYFEDFIVRPIKNFLTRSKDFNVKSGINGAIEIELKELEEEGD